MLFFLGRMTRWLFIQTDANLKLNVSKGTVLLYRLCFFGFQTAGVYLKPYEQKKLLFGQGRGHGIVRKLFGLRFSGCDVWGTDVCNTNQIES